MFMRSMHYIYALALLAILSCLLLDLVLLSRMSERITPLKRGKNAIVEGPRLDVRITSQYFWFDIYW